MHLTYRTDRRYHTIRAMLRCPPSSCTSTCCYIISTNSYMFFVYSQLNTLSVNLTLYSDVLHCTSLYCSSLHCAALYSTKSLSYHYHYHYHCFRGFIDCFRSVRCAVLQVLQALLAPTCRTQSRKSNGSSKKKEVKEWGKEKGKAWQIYTTGHSLGGALATLCAFELGRLREGEWMHMRVTDHCGSMV